MNRPTSLFLFLPTHCRLGWTRAQRGKLLCETRRVPLVTTLRQKSIWLRLVPTPQQVVWQQMETGGFPFICDQYKHPAPDVNLGRWKRKTPISLNPARKFGSERMLIQQLEEAGFKMVILTAKHHGGFCLWLQATTKHSMYSSWKNGPRRRE